MVAALAARGHPPDADPDALIDLEVARLASGPMLLAVLEQDGIDVIGIESFDVVTGTRWLMRVTVRPGELAAASMIADRLR